MPHQFMHVAYTPHLLYIHWSPQICEKPQTRGLYLGNPDLPCAPEPAADIGASAGKREGPMFARRASSVSPLGARRRNEEAHRSGARRWCQWRIGPNEP